MSTFGTVSFILKTSTVTFVVFEESSAVEASCRCDYLDQYPVTIRPVLDSAAGGSIETCILEQIEQNNSLLEGHINNFMQLLDMENLDEYLDMDEKEKNSVEGKPLLEVGNEEIIATESDEVALAADDADVAAIEKQALQQQRQTCMSNDTVLVDEKTAKILKLSKNSLQLSDLPQLNVAVQKISKNIKDDMKRNHKSKNSKSTADSKELDTPKNEYKPKPTLGKEKHTNKSEKKHTVKAEHPKKCADDEKIMAKDDDAPVKEKVKHVKEESGSSKKHKHKTGEKHKRADDAKPTPDSAHKSSAKRNEDSLELPKCKKSEKRSDDTSDDKNAVEPDLEMPVHAPNESVDAKIDEKASRKPRSKTKSSKKIQKEVKQPSPQKDLQESKVEEQLKSENSKKDEPEIKEKVHVKDEKEGTNQFSDENTPNLELSQLNQLTVHKEESLDANASNLVNMENQHTGRKKMGPKKEFSKRKKTKEAESESKKLKSTDSDQEEAGNGENNILQVTADTEASKTEDAKPSLAKDSSSGDEVAQPPVSERVSTSDKESTEKDSVEPVLQEKSSGIDGAIGESSVLVEQSEVETTPTTTTEINVTSTEKVEPALNDRTDTSSSDDKANVVEETQSDTVIEVSLSVPDVCNTVEISQNDSATNLMSDDEHPLIIDIPSEPIKQPTTQKLEEQSLDHGEKKRLSVLLDSKSAALLGGKVHDGCFLYLDVLPRVSVKLKRVTEADRIVLRQAEPPKPKPVEKTSVKKVTFDTPVKKKDDKPPEKIRKTDLEKIDNKFLPAGSKLKSQAKAKSKLASNHKKHLPVPELPIELKAHLNTSFKIPKKNADVKAQSIDRNPTELDCLHREQAREERDRQRKRFQKERTHWEGRPGPGGPRDKKPKRPEPPVRAERQPSPECFDTAFDDNCDSPPPPSSSQTAKDEVKTPQTPQQRINRNEQPSGSREHGEKRISFRDIWNLPSEKPEIWAKPPEAPKPAVNPWAGPVVPAHNNTIDSGELWSSDQPTPRFSDTRDNKCNNTIDSGENWSPVGPPSRKSEPVNTINSGESWSPGGPPNRTNDRSRFTTNRQPAPAVNTIDDGESWSPGCDTRPVNHVEIDRTAARDADQGNRRRQFDSTRSRSPRVEQRSDTIASGDMWDSGPVFGPKSQPPNRGNKGNTLLSEETWDDEIVPSSHSAERQVGKEFNYDQRFQDRNETLSRRDRDPSFSASRHDGSRSQDRRSPRQGSPDVRANMRQSPNRQPFRGRSPGRDRRRNSMERLPPRSRSPEGRGWSRNDSPIRRKRSRSRSPDRNRRNFERSPVRGIRSIDRSPDRRPRGFDRPVSPWGRSGVRSPMRQINSRSRSPILRRPSIDQFPPKDRFNRSPDRRIGSSNRDRFQGRSRSPDQLPPSEQRDQYIENRYRNRRSCSRSPQRPGPSLLDPWDSSVIQGNRKNPFSDRYPGYDRSRSQSPDHWVTKELAEPGDKSWDSPRSNENRTPQPVNRIDSTHYDHWVNESGPLQDNAYSPSSALDAVSSDDECDFTNPSRKADRALAASQSSSFARKSFETIPLKIPSHTNLASVNLGNPATETAGEFSRDSFDSMAPFDEPIQDEHIYESSSREALSDSNAMERKNVLEHLKQRAERLKKLEDMKLARQKLLAQIKMKSDNNSQQSEIDPSTFDTDPMENVPSSDASRKSRFGPLLHKMPPGNPEKPHAVMLMNNPLLAANVSVDIPHLLKDGPASSPPHEPPPYDTNFRMPVPPPGTSASWQQQNFSTRSVNAIDVSKPPPHMSNPLFNSSMSPSQEEEEPMDDYEEPDFHNDPGPSRFQQSNQSFNLIVGQQNRMQFRPSQPPSPPQDEPVQLFPAEEIRFQKNGFGRDFNERNKQRNRDPRQRFGNNNRQMQQNQRGQRQNSRGNAFGGFPQQQNRNFGNFNNNNNNNNNFNNNNNNFNNNNNNFNNRGNQFQRFNQNQQQQFNFQQQNQRNNNDPFNQSFEQIQQQLFQCTDFGFDGADEGGCFDMNEVDCNDGDADWADLME